MKRASGQLEAARLAAIAECVADVLVLIDAEGRLRWANRAAEVLVGADLEEWIGRSGLDLVHPDDLELAVLSLATLQSKQVGTPIELRVRSTTGWRLMELVGSRLGSTDEFVLALRDLTERRRWEVAGDDVAAFRSIVQNAADVMVLLAPDGTVLSASGAITRVLGLDPELVCGRPFADLVSADDRSALGLGVRQATESTGAGGVAAVIEVHLCSRHGVEVPFELSFVSLLDDPTVEGIVVSGHDITRLRIAQDALAELAHYDSLTGS